MILYQISQKFKIRDLGEAETFLGMEIVRDRKRKTLKIKQTKYIENMAERFGLTDAKPVYTPMDPKINLQKAKRRSELHPDNELCRSIVGSAMYAATLSRPDIMFSVCKLSRYLNEPTKAHMTQAKRRALRLKIVSKTVVIFARVQSRQGTVATYDLSFSRFVPDLPANCGHHAALHDG